MAYEVLGMSETRGLRLRLPLRVRPAYTDC